MKNLKKTDSKIYQAVLIQKYINLLLVKLKGSKMNYS